MRDPGGRRVVGALKFWGTTRRAPPLPRRALPIHAATRGRESLTDASLEERSSVFAIQFRDETCADLGRANGFAFVGVGAIAETFRVHLPAPFSDARERSGCALRQKGQMRNLRRGEKHRGSVRARRRTGAAANAGCCFHRQIGVMFRHRNRVRFRGGTGAGGDETAGLHDAIERAAIDDQILAPAEKIWRETARS